jgi:hypothetical protein
MNVDQEIVDPARQPKPLLARVRVRAGSEVRRETARVVSISAAGAGLYIDSECTVGRLISILVPLDPHLRCYDHGSRYYRVWGLVQHCHRLPGERSFHVGVALIGKFPPASYRQDPMQSYNICGMAETGLWKIREAKKDFKKRRDPRFFKAIDLYLAVVDSRSTRVGGEWTTTENISKSGAAVFSSLDVNVGDRVKFISEEYDFSGLAVVCNRKVGADSRSRLHLHFVDHRFPIESIILPKMEEADAMWQPA